MRADSGTPMRKVKSRRQGAASWKSRPGTPTSRDHQVANAVRGQVWVSNWVTIASNPADIATVSGTMDTYGHLFQDAEDLGEGPSTRPWRQLWRNRDGT